MVIFVLRGVGVKPLRGGAAPYPLTPQNKRDRPLAARRWGRAELEWLISRAP
jgi:hypothetical protein